MILEAEQNKIDLAITHNDTFSRTHLYFNNFDYHIVYKKLYTTSSLKHVDKKADEMKKKFQKLIWYDDLCTGTEMY